MKCPRCKGSRVRARSRLLDSLSWLAAGTLFAWLAFYLWPAWLGVAASAGLAAWHGFGPRRNVCLDCGLEWRQGRGVAA